MFPLGLAENSIQLVPDGTLLLHVVIILGMVFVLDATLFRPINRILEAREKHTGGRKAEARNILQSVSEKMAHYEQTLRQARGQAYAFTETQRSAAMQARQEKLNQMRERLAESMAREKEAIQQQAQEARRSLEEEARRVAREIGTRLLGRPVGGASTN